MQMITREGEFEKFCFVMEPDLFRTCNLYILHEKLRPDFS